ncbi:MAG: hypothetical protein U1F98_14210 [Verrucomicrobiota bacterium]
MTLNNKSTLPYTVTFVGEVPVGQQQYSNLPTTARYFSLVASMVPRTGTLVDLGFSWGGRGPDISVCQRRAGNDGDLCGGAWVPAAPTIQAGEAFVVQTAGVASRDPWVKPTRAARRR